MSLKINLIDARPHPAFGHPLPQGEGEHLSRFDDLKRVGCNACCFAFNKTAKIGSAIQKFDENARAGSLSLGERAGVRAGYSLNSIFIRSNTWN
jgi:hypothetical protein